MLKIVQHNYLFGRAHFFYVAENKLKQIRYEKKPYTDRRIDYRLNGFRDAEIEYTSNDDFEALVKIDSHFNKDDFNVSSFNIVPGHYYSRIFRPFLPIGNGSITFPNQYTPHIEHLYGYSEIPPYNESILISGLNQLQILISFLKDIFRTVYPSNNNLSVYGHDIRNLILLSCTEFEAQMAGILKANNVQPSSKSSYKSNDFVRLKDILKLEEYSIKLTQYPQLLIENPFKGWVAEGSTKTLRWYDDYNAVKHDREEKFHLSSLENAIKSVTAISIVFYAQYGPLVPHWNDLIGNFFTIESTPEWMIHDAILPPWEGEEWNPIAFPLS